MGGAGWHAGPASMARFPRPGARRPLAGPAPACFLSQGAPPPAIPRPILALIRGDRGGLLAIRRGPLPAPRHGCALAPFPRSHLSPAPPLRRCFPPNPEAFSLASFSGPLTHRQPWIFAGIDGATEGRVLRSILGAAPFPSASSGAMQRVPTPSPLRDFVARSLRPLCAVFLQTKWPSPRPHPPAVAPSNSP